MMTIADQIYALVKALPPEQASEVLDFAEFIRAKHSRAEQTVSWTELVHSLAGAWKDDFSTLEEIRADSAPDISRETL